MPRVSLHGWVGGPESEHQRERKVAERVVGGSGSIQRAMNSSQKGIKGMESGTVFSSKVRQGVWDREMFSGRVWGRKMAVCTTRVS